MIFGIVPCTAADARHIAGRSCFARERRKVKHICAAWQLPSTCDRGKAAS
jgi:hypothetical protein